MFFIFQYTKPLETGKRKKNSDEEILQKLPTICLRENPIGSPPNNGLNQLAVGFCEA